MFKDYDGKKKEIVTKKIITQFLKSTIFLFFGNFHLGSICVLIQQYCINTQTDIGNLENQQR